ncbi:ribose-phosphate pyrophosphokinase [Hominifimenecus sp. rT4P-3]|uniref:ribose-phosphate pyrophosphokinase n=1 Tax=Hominifimenecus sp. rT4P-3 TaxID=3242979 RepID=UPI003DA67777
MAKDYTFKNTIPLAPLKIIAMENCGDLGKKVDEYIVSFRKNDKEILKARENNIEFRGYDRDSYLAHVSCPRFGSGEAKGTISESVRGADVFIITDVINYSITYSMYGKEHLMSPDDHYQDLKRIISAALPTARRVNVVMPFLYESRQHKRTQRESLDCAIALEELANMGVANIITYDAHDPRVQNAIPLHDFDSFSAVYQFMKTLLHADKTLTIDKNSLMVISPDEGAMGRAVYLANNLGVDMGMFYKRRDYSKIVNGKNPIVAHEFLGSDVEGKDVIIIDDMIASGDSMLDTAKELKRRKAKKVIVCCTFGLFTSGFDHFDEAYQNGDFDYVITTNLNYRKPELLEKPWYREADMSKYVATIINTLNHDVATSGVMSPTEKVQRLINRYKDDDL